MPPPLASRAQGQARECHGCRPQPAASAPCAHGALWAGPATVLLWPLSGRACGLVLGPPPCPCSLPQEAWDGPLGGEGHSLPTRGLSLERPNALPARLGQAVAPAQVSANTHAHGRRAPCSGCPGAWPGVGCVHTQRPRAFRSLLQKGRLRQKGWQAVPRARGVWPELALAAVPTGRGRTLGHLSGGT